MTDEEIYQAFRKHILEYESKNARAPYGWFTAILDAQKEILSTSMREEAIGFAEWAGKKGYKYYNGNWYKNGRNDRNIGNSDQLYNEYLKSSVQKTP